MFVQDRHISRSTRCVDSPRIFQLAETPREDFQIFFENVFILFLGNFENFPFLTFYDFSLENVEFLNFIVFEVYNFGIFEHLLGT